MAGQVVAGGANFFSVATIISKIRFSHSPFPICCILSQYLKRTGDIFMAISTQDLDFHDQFLIAGTDLAFVLDGSFIDPTERISHEDIYLAPKLDDIDDLDEEDDEDEDEDEDEDDDLDDDDEEDEDDEDDDEEYDDDEDDEEDDEDEDDEE
jgi:hypothetical protein